MTDTNPMANDAMIPSSATQATTANEAAGLVFPKIAQHFEAFWEKEASMSEAPSIVKIELVTILPIWLIHEDDNAEE